MNENCRGRNTGKSKLDDERNREKEREKFLSTELHTHSVCVPKDVVAVKNGFAIICVRTK